MVKENRRIQEIANSISLGYSDLKFWFRCISLFSQPTHTHTGKYDIS